MTGIEAVGHRIAEIRARISTIAIQLGVPFEGVLANVRGTDGAAASDAGEAARSEPITERAPNELDRALGAGTGESVLIGMLGQQIAAAPASVAYRPAGPPTLPAGSWAEELPERGQRWAGPIEQAAYDVGIDPRLLGALMWAESTFVPDAVSHAGAIGLTQLMPGTAEGLGVDPWDPIQNIEGGARYLAWTLEEFESLELGLAAYNAGPGRVRNAGGVPDIAETRAYITRVFDYYDRLGGFA